MNRSFSFFHQVGWVMIAVAAGGVCNTLIHVFARMMPKDEYSLLGTSLQFALPALSLPAIGLQIVFAQLSAEAVTEESKRKLASAMRGVSLALLGLWVIAATGVAIFQKSILSTYKVGGPAMLVVIMSIALLNLLQPMLAGVLQGRQQFLWFGWVTILSSIGRVAGGAALLSLLGGRALWAICGVLIGAGFALAAALWPTRDLWKLPAGRFEWRPLVRKAAPLTVAMGSLQLFSSLDISVARAAFSEETSSFYVAAGTIGRALIFLTGAVTTVMFPRIVNEAANSTKSSVLAQALGLTLGVGALTALVCSAVPELPLQIIHGSKYLSAGPLVPWFAWCLLPLTLATTLVNNLVARGRYGIIAPLALIVIGYWAWLQYRFSKEQMQLAPATFETLIQSMGVAALAACLAAIVMTWLPWRSSAKH